MAVFIFDSEDKDNDALGAELFAKLDIFNSSDDIEWSVDEHIALRLLNHNTIKTFIASQIIEKTIHKYQALDTQSHILNEQILICVIKAFELMDENHLLYFATLPHLFDILFSEIKKQLRPIPLPIISRFLSSNALPYNHKETICKLIHRHQLLYPCSRSQDSAISPELNAICAIYRPIMMEHVFHSWKLHHAYFRDIEKEIQIADDVIAVIHSFVGCLYQSKHMYIGGTVYYNNCPAAVLDTTVLAAKALHNEQTKRKDGAHDNNSDLMIPEICLKDIAEHYRYLPQKFMINFLRASMPFATETNLRIAKLMTDDLMENHDAIFNCLHDFDQDWIWLQLESGEKKVVKPCEIEKIDFKAWYQESRVRTQYINCAAIIMFGHEEWTGCKVKVIDTWNDDFAVIEDAFHCKKLILFEFLCPDNTLPSMFRTPTPSSSAPSGRGLFGYDYSTGDTDEDSSSS